MVPHRWHDLNYEWTCTECGETHPDPCQCPCCQDRTGGLASFTLDEDTGERLRRIGDGISERYGLPKRQA